MSDDVITLVLDANGLVVRAAIGHPEDIPVDDGEVAVLRSGPSADAWVGWKRAADGTFALPVAPVAPVAPPTKAELVTYTLRRRWEISETKAVPTTIASGTYPLLIGAATRAALGDAMTSIQLDPGYAISKWFIPSTLQSIRLDAASIQIFALKARDEFQLLFEYQDTVLTGIAAGSITTPAQIETKLAGG